MDIPDEIDRKQKYIAEIEACNRRIHQLEIHIKRWKLYREGKDGPITHPLATIDVWIETAKKGIRSAEASRHFYARKLGWETRYPPPTNA